MKIILVATDNRGKNLVFVSDALRAYSLSEAVRLAPTDEGKGFVDLRKKPEIIATLYHLPRRPLRSNPDPNDRGLQITGEFYTLAKEWLR